MIITVRHYRVSMEGIYQYDVFGVLAGKCHDGHHSLFWDHIALEEDEARSEHERLREKFRNAVVVPIDDPLTGRIAHLALRCGCHCLIGLDDIPEGKRSFYKLRYG